MFHSSLIFSTLFLTLSFPALVWAQPVENSPSEDVSTEGTPSETPNLEEVPSAEAASSTAAKKLVVPAEEPVLDTSPDVSTDMAAKKAVVERKSDFVDTRINFTFTNENVLADPDETHVPNIPGYRFGVPNSLGTLFFDNYDTRFSGFETLSHAVLYKKHRSGHWDAEGAFVLRFNDVAERDITLSDAGSYVRLAYWLDKEQKDPDRVTLTAFPTSSNRFRLGYSYRLSWGGSDEYQRSKHAVPGFKLQWENDKIYAFVGAKSAVLLDRKINEERAVQSYLAGAGIDLSDLVRVEVNGGYFDRGTNEQQDVLNEHVRLFGASAQVSIGDGLTVGSSVDYRLYRNDLEGVRNLGRKKDVYPGGLAWAVAAEATMLGQTLKDPEKTGSTVIQKAKAGDINVRVKYDHTRFHLDAQYRDLAYILHTSPSLPSYEDFSKEFDIKPNIFAAAGVDQHFPDLNLTTGLVFGVEIPATLASPKALPGDMVSSGKAVYVVRQQGDVTILPPGKEAAAQFATKFSGRIDFADNHFATILDIYYSYDPNRTRLARSGAEELLRYKFDDFNQLGFNLTLQARF